MIGIIGIADGLKGQTIGGAEIYYQTLSYRKYLVTAQVYRQCKGAALKNLDGYAVSDSFKIAMNFKRISIAKINDTCGNPCQNSNDSSNEGYEKHIFIDTIDFNKAPYNKFVNAGNCQIHFAIHQLLRPVTTTLSNSNTNQMFFLDAMVDICQYIKSNHSPNFTFEPKFYIPCNQIYRYNMGFIDTFDFDSIGLTLSAPLTDFKTQVSYNGSYKPTIPMTPFCPPNPGVINCRPLPSALPPRGFYFNAETGDINFTPVKCDEIGVIKITASEYRKDSTNKTVLIGQTSREMIVSIKQSSYNNYLPYITTGNPTLSICENNKLCFSLKAKDDPYTPYQKISDTVHIYWNKGIPLGTFTIRDSAASDKDIDFCWTSGKNKSGFINRFGVAAYDRLCNINFSSIGYVIYKYPQLKLITEIAPKCNILHYNIINTDSSYNINQTTNYQVSLKSINSPTQNIFQSTKPTDSFKLSKSGIYYLEVIANNTKFKCPITIIDTIEIKDIDLEISYAKDSFFCQFDSVYLSPVQTLSSDVAYKWYDSYYGKTVVDSVKTYKFLNNGAKRTVRVETSDKNNCVLKDEVQIISRGSFERNPADSILYLCEKLKDSIGISKISGTPPYTINWYLDNSYAGSDSTLKLTLFKNTRLRIEITDSANCTYIDTSLLMAIKKPVINMKDTAICINTNALILSKVTGQGNLKYQWILDNVLDTQQNSNFRLKVLGTYLLNLKVTANNKCESQKTVLIDYLPLPQFTILADTVYNKADFIKLDLSKTFSSYKWNNSATTKKNEFWAYTLGAPGTYQVWCEVTDSNGCKNTSTVNIRTNGRTGIDALLKDGFLFYPNPVKDLLYIEALKESPYEVFDVNGKSVMTGKLNIGSNVLDMSSLSAGVYVVKVGGLEMRVVRE